MGAKHSKREAAYGSTSPRGSPSSKIARSRSLPIRVFPRRLNLNHGGSFRETPVHEEVEELNHLKEYQKLIELEKSQGKENAGFCGGTDDIIRSCISPSRGSEENVVYEEEDHDNVADESPLAADVEGLRDSPPFLREGRRPSRLSSHSSPCLSSLAGEAKGFNGADLIREAHLVDSYLSGAIVPAAEKPEEVAGQLSDDINPLVSEDQSDEIICKDVDQCVLPSTKPVDKFVNFEKKESSSSNEASSQPEVTLEFSFCSDEEEEQGRGAGTDCEGPKKYHSETFLSGAWEWEIPFKFQAQKSSERPRYRRLRRKFSCDQEQERAEEAGNMSGKAKVSLSLNSSKRQKDSRRNSFTDGSDIVWGTSSGKRMKDGDGGEESAPSDIHPDAFAWGLMGQSDPFLGFDAAGFFSQLPAEEDQMKGGYMRRSRTPSKASRGKALARKVRGLRASPKPVSSLESCLRAQLIDESDRDRARSVSRPLNFSSAADGKGKYEDLNMIGYIAGVPFSPDASPDNTNMGTSKSGKTSGSSGSVGLPNLLELLKGYAAKLAVGKDERGSAGEAKTAKGAGNDQPSASPRDSRWKKTLLPVVLKKRKISDMKEVLSMGSNRGINRLNPEDVSVGPMEGLLFSFGVGVGVLSVANTKKVEVERLSQLLNESQAQVQNLKLMLERMGGPTVRSYGAGGAKVDKKPDLGGERISYGASRDAHGEAASEDLESVRSLVSQQQGDQMAELEAELEAELDQLTGGGESVAPDSQYSVLDELDMDGVASIVHGDLTVTGLPARVEESSDDDDYSAPAQPASMNNYAVSPRELTRLLRKLQATRQEELFTELEEELEAVQSKLQSKEKELELWKDRVRRLTEVSFASDAECLTPRTPQGAATPFEGSSTPNDTNIESKNAMRSSDTLDGQESFHFPLQGPGALASCTPSDTDRAGSESSDGPIPLTLPEEGTRDEKLRTEFAEQKPRDVELEISRGDNPSASDDVCNEFLQSMIDGEVEAPTQAELAMQAVRDCRPMMDNAQLEKQLINSVQEMETPDFVESSDMGSATPSVGDFSSAVSFADDWDRSLNPATLQRNDGKKGVHLHQPKLLVPHPSRRASWNSEAGHAIHGRKAATEEPLSPEVDSSRAIVKYAEPLKSSKSVSDMSDAETADYKTSDTPYSVKYVDTSARPALESGALAEQNNALYWDGLGRAGLNTPVEKVRQQLFKDPRETAPDQRPLYLDRRPGDLSPTVLDKIARWEGLMEGETPGPATGSDWECQSRASESEQQCNMDSMYDNINVFGEENLVLEAEEMLGRLLINRIVEKTRRGSHIVKEAQSALATLERDDGGAGETHTTKAAETTQRAGSDGSSFSERDYDLRESWSDDQGKTPTSFLEDAVREEYEFFRRLELINRDRKAAKGVKEKPAKETVYLGSPNIGIIPELDLGANPQVSQSVRPRPASQDSEPFRVKEAPSVGSGDQAEELAKGMPGRWSGDSKNRGRDNWLVRGDTRQELYAGSGYREDEVRSRRRL